MSKNLALYFIVSCPATEKYREYSLLIPYFIDEILVFTCCQRSQTSQILCLDLNAYHLLTEKKFLTPVMSHYQK